VDNASTDRLSDWLRDLGQDTRGTASDKRTRVLAHTKYLETPLMDFPDQTMVYLDSLTSDQLATLCELLGVDSDGTKGLRYRRVLHEVGYRENWLPRLCTITDSVFAVDTVIPFVRWYRAIKGGLERERFLCGLHG